jgi:hypothetical protein
MKQRIVSLLQENRPDLLKNLDLSSLSDEEVLTLYSRAVQEAKDRHERQRAACAVMFAERVAAASLPELAKQRLRREFQNRVFRAEELDEWIHEEQDFLASLAAARGEGQVDLESQERIAVGLEAQEKRQIAVDKLFGVTRADAQDLLKLKTIDGRPAFNDLRASAAQEFDEVPAFGSLREAYAFFTGDPEVSGYFDRKRIPRDLRAGMDITSSTFTYVLGNTLGRRLVAEYRFVDWKESLLISTRKPVKDFRQQEVVLTGEFPNLSIVDPEAADYAEIAGVTDEESTYTVGQKGNILTITRKTIINDDIALIQRLVRGLGRSARRTHAEYVWAMWIDNDACTDGTAWHTVGHGNYGTSALTHATALTAFTALAKMTAKDSGKRIGLLSDLRVKPNLFGPPDLLAEINRVVNEDFYYTGAADITTKLPNPLKDRVVGHEIALLTDTTDWGMALPPDVVEHTEMGYLNGREEPEFFVADTPQAEQVFVADKIRYKIRHEYAGVPVDYRGSYKAEVP